MSNLDAIDHRLLQLLQANDQASLGALGRVVGLAPSSVKERIKRLVAQGVISGFHAKVSPSAVGLDLLALVFVSWVDPSSEAPFLKRVVGSAAVLECHHVTGAWNYMLKVRLRNTGELERFLADVIKTLPGVQRTETLIVLSSAKDSEILRIEAEEGTDRRREPQRRRSAKGRRGR